MTSWLGPGEREEVGEVDEERQKEYVAYIKKYHMPSLATLGIPIFWLIDQVWRWINSGELMAPTYEEWLAEAYPSPGPGEEGGERLTFNEFQELKTSDPDRYLDIITNPDALSNFLLPDMADYDYEYVWGLNPEEERTMWTLTEVGAEPPEPEVGITPYPEEREGYHWEWDGIGWVEMPDEALEPEGLAPGAMTDWQRWQAEQAEREFEWGQEQIGQPTEYTEYQQAQIGLQTYIAENQAQIDQAYLALQQQEFEWEQQQAGVLDPWQKEQLQLAYDQLNAEQNELNKQFQLAEQQQQYQQAYGQESLELQQQGLQFQQEQAAMQAEQEYMRHLTHLAAQPISWLDYSMNANVTPLVQPFMMPLMSQEYQGLGGTQIGAPIPNWESIKPYLSQSQLYGAPEEFTPIQPVGQLPTFGGIESTYDPIEWTPPQELLGGQGGMMTPEGSGGFTPYTGGQQGLPPAYSPVPVPGSPELSYVNRQIPPPGASPSPIYRYETPEDLEGTIASLADVWGKSYEDAEEYYYKNYYQKPIISTPEERGANMYDANIRAYARREMEGQDMSEKIARLAETYGLELGEVRQAIDERENEAWGMPLPMKRGGIVNKPTLAWIGEEGPEAVVPLGGSRQSRTGYASARPDLNLSSLKDYQTRQEQWNVGPTIYADPTDPMASGADVYARYLANMGGGSGGAGGYTPTWQETSQHMFGRWNRPMPSGGMNVPSNVTNINDWMRTQLYGSPAGGGQVAPPSPTAPQRGSYVPPRMPRPDQLYGGTSPTPEPYLPLGGLPQLTRPSQQYMARMGPTAMQQYYGYEQARTGASPQEQMWRLQQMAPPGGRYSGLTWLR